MSQRLYSRGPLTDALIAYLNAGLVGKSLLIGDGIAPPSGGWSGGQAGVGSYVPYAVLNAGSAQPNQKETVLGRNTSWRQPYSVSCYGGSRQQADWVSDQLKPLVDTFSAAVPAPGLRTLDLDAPWKVVLSNYTSLGGPARTDQVDPPVWSATDNFVLWLEHATI